MTLTFVNPKVENVEISIDGKNKHELKDRLHQLLKANGMRLTGWKAKHD